MDKVGLDFGVMTDGFRQRYNDWMRPVGAAEQLQADLNGALRPVPGVSTVPYDQPRNNARGLRNHNPGNVRAAPNAVGSDGSFPQFGSDADGLAAMARQLMLYGDRGNNSISGILHTYAPSSENNTRAYIDDVSRATGYQAQDRVNLHDPAVLRNLMSAMISHENGTQPFSRDQLDAGVSSAIFDDRWSGLRDNSILAQQRGAGDGAGGDIGQAIKTAFDDNPLKLDVTITNDQTGSRKSTTVNNGGRVVFPMSNN
jgi:hypothetical protein